MRVEGRIGDPQGLEEVLLEVLLRGAPLRR